MGSTIPDVPRTDRPPTIPSLGLNVFFAVSSPSGIEIVTFISPQYPQARHMRSTSSVIILRGTLLIAACPICCSSPGFVTLPTPMPPSSMTRSPEDSSSPFSTFAYIRSPSVTSGSSPLYFLTAHSTRSGSLVTSSTSRYSSIPFGVISLTCRNSSPEKSISAAAFAAAAAQLPVVHP